MTPRRAFLSFGALALALVACAEDPPRRADRGAAEAAERVVETLDARPAPSGSASSQPGADEPEPLRPAFSHSELASLIDELSEPNGDFFSDNYISNETSYLQVADDLDEHLSGDGVYIGVGPEQNFTYLALAQPKLAFIVDIRRDNMVLHLMYKAAFDLARDRAHFLALLTGRADDGQTLSQAASLEDVLAHVDGLEASAETASTAKEAIVARIAEGYGIALDARDQRSLSSAHAAFAEEGLDLRFELKQESFRKYPSLRELITSESPEGEPLGFLAKRELFERVQRMQRENRVVPLVGNFAGDRTLPGLAKLMAEKGLTLDAFYVSNVEQYLLVDGLWWKWKRNIEALPVDEESLFIRCYLDQGRPHPKQLSGHRTTTVLQRVATFEARERPYPSMLALSTDGLLASR